MDSPLEKEITARKQAEHALGERVKELHCLRELSRLVQADARSVESLLSGVVNLLPPAWQFSDDSVGLIRYQDQVYQTSDFSRCIDIQRSPLLVEGDKLGEVAVGYLSAHPPCDEGPFLSEERKLLDMVAEVVRRSVERILAEQTLRASEKRYRLLADNTVDVIWTTDLALNFTYVNPAVANLLGYSAQEVVGTSVSDYANEEDTATMVRVASEAVADGDDGEGMVVEAVLIHRDGSPIPVEVRGKAVFDEQGDPVGLQGTTRDISERKQAQKELRQSEERHRRLFETMAQGSILLDAAGTVVAVNAAAVRILGCRREDLLGLEAENVWQKPVGPEGKEFPTEDLPSVLALQNRRRVAPVSMGVFNPMDDGYRWLLVSAVPQVDDAESLPFEVNVTFEDVTALRQANERRSRAESRLRQAQKLEAVGRLAGGIAHDFNNMLSIILGNTELVLAELDENSPLRVELMEVQSAAQKSGQLTQQLLTFARLQDVSVQKIDLNQRVDNSLRMLKRLLSEEIELKWKPSDYPVIVELDPAQLDQILMNLTINARDAISGVGTIAISTELKKLGTSDPQLSDSNIPAGTYAVMTLSDTGVGMDRDTLSKLFEPFFSTKPVGEGTGLGLATVHGIVEQHGGYIHVYSEPGEGTVVRVYLPQAEGESQASQDSDETETLATGEELIMLVEDEEPLLKLTERLLTRMGYEVLSASSPKRALELFRERSDQVDLLLTDVVMPEKNGRELYEEMRESNPRLKCLFMSGYTFEILARRGLDEPNLQLLQKPFSIAELGNSVRRVLSAEGLSP